MRDQSAGDISRSLFSTGYMQDVRANALSIENVYQLFRSLEEARKSVLTEGLKVPQFRDRIVSLITEETAKSGTTTGLEIRRRAADRILSNLREAIPGIVAGIERLNNCVSPLPETQAIAARRQIAEAIWLYRIKDRAIVKIWEDTQQGDVPSAELERVQHLKDRIVSGSLPMVFKLADFECRRWGRMSEINEVTQGGNIGLIRAVDRYDGVGRFSTYAWPWIRQGVESAMRTVLESPMGFPSPDYRAIQLVTEAQCALREKGGDPFDVESIFSSLRQRDGKRSPTKLEIQDVLDRPLRPHVFPLGGVYDEPEVEAPCDAELMPNAEESVRNALRKLRDADREVLELYFGLNGSEPRNMEDIGSLYGGISRAAVSLRVIAAKARIRKVLEAQQAELDD